MRRGVLCTFLLAGAILGSSRSAGAAFNPQYDNRATCGSSTAEVKLTKSSSGGTTTWTATNIPREAYTSSITKDAKSTVKIPNDLSMVLRMKNSAKSSFTFIGSQVYKYVDNEVTINPSTGQPTTGGTTEDVLTLYGSIIVNTSDPYATFGSIFYQQSTKKYSKMPGGYARIFDSITPNYSTHCSLKVDLASYKLFMKAVGQDVGDNEGAKEDTSTLTGLDSDGGGLVNIDADSSDNESVCGKPKLKGIMRYAFCLLLDFLVETLVDFI